MKCLDDCHAYMLDNKIEDTVQHVFFYKMAEGGVKDNGTTNEEVLAMLIHRMKQLNKVLPCTENNLIIQNLEGAMVWMTLREQDRDIRGVQGTHKP